jgi:16S rRNA processing protein RimM
MSDPIVVGSLGESGEPQRIVVGSLGKPHGLKGEVVLLTGSDDLSQFKKGAIFLTQDGDELVVRTFRDHSGTPIISFQGIDHRDQCQVLRAVQLTVDPGDRRDLSEDEFWTEDLVGLAVVDASGQRVGVVREVIFGSSQDRLAIEVGEEVSEVPFVEVFFPKVDFQTREITIAPIEGLL